MKRYKSLVLPVALVAGYFLRHLCAVLAVAVPYVIFSILVLTFAGVRLSALRPSKLDLWVATFQTAVSLAGYLAVMSLTADAVIAQGVMMCVLCPVASSVTVVASMLGADPGRTTTYTIVGNLLVALVAPVYLTAVTETAGVSFVGLFALIFCKIAFVIAVPYFLVLLIQRCWRGLNTRLAGIKSLSFYLWAFALFVTIGQTADFVVRNWHGDASVVLRLGVASLVICATQFAVGRLIGRRYGDEIAGGQMLAQKNSAMGIWIINTFLNPVASVALAFYSIWQNIFNSWQIYRSASRPRR